MTTFRPQRLFFWIKKKLLKEQRFETDLQTIEAAIKASELDQEIKRKEIVARLAPYEGNLEKYLNRHFYGGSEKSHQEWVEDTYPKICGKKPGTMHIVKDDGYI